MTHAPSRGNISSKRTIFQGQWIIASALAYCLYIFYQIAFILDSRMNEEICLNVLDKNLYERAFVSDMQSQELVPISL